MTPDNGDDDEYRTPAAFDEVVKARESDTQVNARKTTSNDAVVILFTTDLLLGVFIIIMACIISFVNAQVESSLFPPKSE